MPSRQVEPFGKIWQVLTKNSKLHVAARSYRVDKPIPHLHPFG